MGIQMKQQNLLVTEAITFFKSSLKIGAHSYYGGFENRPKTFLCNQFGGEEFRFFIYDWKKYTKIKTPNLFDNITKITFSELIEVTALRNDEIITQGLGVVLLPGMVVKFIKIEKPENSNTDHLYFELPINGLQFHLPIEDSHVFSVYSESSNKALESYCKNHNRLFDINKEMRINLGTLEVYQRIETTDALRKIKFGL